VLSPVNSVIWRFDLKAERSSNRKPNAKSSENVRESVRNPFDPAAGGVRVDQLAENKGV